MGRLGVCLGRDSQRAVCVRIAAKRPFRRDFEKTNARTFFIMPEVLGMVSPAPARRLARWGWMHTFSSAAIKPVKAGQPGDQSEQRRSIDLAPQINEPFQPPVVLISGGELIVTVGQKGHRRAQSGIRWLPQWCSDGGAVSPWVQSIQTARMVQINSLSKAMAIFRNSRAG